MSSGYSTGLFYRRRPLFCECQKTGRLLAERSDCRMIAGRSASSPASDRKQWLQPYTDKTLSMLARAGTKSVHVICPGFSADCLETLERLRSKTGTIFWQPAANIMLTFLP